MSYFNQTTTDNTQGTQNCYIPFYPTGDWPINPWPNYPTPQNPSDWIYPMRPVTIPDFKEVNYKLVSKSTHLAMLKEILDSTNIPYEVVEKVVQSKELDLSFTVTTISVAKTTFIFKETGELITIN